MAVDPVILAAFGPPPADVDLSASDVAKNNGAVIAMLCLAAVAVILRFVARIILRNALLADDWAIIGALICIGATTGISVAGGTTGSGKHIWAVTLDQLILVYKLLYSYTFIYASSCTLTRISILFFYRRIFSPLEPSLKIALAAGGLFTLSYPLIVWITMANACKPVSFFWTQFSGTAGKCININQFFLAAGILNMLNDFFILVLPFPRIIRLQMTTKKKIAICGIMAVGIFVCVASIVRIHYLSVFMATTDITWLMGPVFIWSTIEPSVAIVTACLPHLAPLAKIAHHSISSSLGSKRDTGATGQTGTRTGAGDSSRPRMFRSSGRGRSHPGLSTLGSKVPTFRPDQSADDDEIGLTNYVTAGSIGHGNGFGNGNGHGHRHRSRDGRGRGRGYGEEAVSKDDSFETRITVRSSFEQASVSKGSRGS
ncbi:hypothetical protein BDW69DRAFT_201095 [Aspergillus filifer]